MASVVIVTGLSGAGKSTVLNVLEDLGFFSMDNLPVVLLPKVLELAWGQEPIDRIAVGIDAREPLFIQDASEIIARLRADGTRVEIVFVDADDEVLLKRYNETRRKHPLERGEGLQHAIQTERDVLQTMRQEADYLLDTSTTKVPDLQRLVRDTFSRELDGRMHLRIVSFGFKHGITPEADLVFDVRFIQNPFFETDLRTLTGMNPSVRDFVLQQESATQFRHMLRELLGFLLPHYEDTGRAYLTVAIGCTGGQHRSVAIGEALAQDLREDGWTFTLEHRENHRWPT